MINNLSDKKVLLFVPQFFGYEKAITQEIQKKCFECHYYDERINPSNLDKIFIRLNLRMILSKKINLFYQTIIHKYETDYFDYVVFFNPETVTVELLKQLKQKQRRAFFILYMWDSLSNKPHTKVLLPFFDKCLSFDRNDCCFYKMKFRPLFFIDSYDSDKYIDNVIKKDIDIGFIGTIHSDRYKILNDIKCWANENGLKTFFFMFFPSTILFYKYKLINMFKFKICKKDFSFKSLESSVVKAYLCRCKVIIDIQHPKQIGLTMRTIEMIGLRKKIITTNQDILNYDFYDKDNVFIIDRKNIKIDKKFISSGYNNKTDIYRKRYGLSSFIDELFECDNIK